MKTKSLLLTLVIAFALFSCNKDDNNEATEEGKAYMALAISFPSGSSDLRAGTTSTETGDGTETGLKVEQDFDNVGVSIVNAAGNVIDYYTLSYSQFTPYGSSAVDDLDSPSGETKVYMSVKHLVPSGNAFVYVFVNPNLDIVNTFGTINYNVKTASTTKPMELTSLTSSDITSAGNIAESGKFLMGNATDPIKSSTVNINGTSLTPTVVTVEVERAAVKLVENTVTRDFDITNSLSYYGTTLKTTLSAYTYDNLNKRSFILKRKEYRTDATNTVAATDSFVVDPNFVTADYGAGTNHWFINDFFTNLSNTNVTKNWAASTITYTLENTMLDNEQYENKTTAIIYKAQIKDAASATLSTFYSYKNKIFTTYALLSAAWTLDHPSTPLSDLFVAADITTVYGGGSFSSAIDGPTTVSSIRALNAQLLKYGVKCYFEGVAYYKWMIKHWDQSAVNLGRMEFALVRNNVYYLKVTSISNLGEPWVPSGQEDPEYPIGGGTDPGSNPSIKPDEESKAYLQVELKVLPWVVRYNDITF